MTGAIESSQAPAFQQIRCHPFDKPELPKTSTVDRGGKPCRHQPPGIPDRQRSHGTGLSRLRIGKLEHMPGPRQLSLRSRRKHDDKEIARSRALRHLEDMVELAIKEGDGSFDRCTGLKQQQSRPPLAYTTLFVAYVEHAHDKVADAQRIKPLHDRPGPLGRTQVEQLGPTGQCPRHGADDCGGIPGRCANKGHAQLQGNQQACNIIETSLVAGVSEMLYKMSKQLGLAGCSFISRSAPYPEERPTK